MPKSASPIPIHVPYLNNPGNMGFVKEQINPLFDPQDKRMRSYKRDSFRDPLGKSNKSKKGGRHRRRKTARRSRSKQ